MDKDLRDAERSGDAAWLLRERLRAGDLTREHVELAARLGHPAAVELDPRVGRLSWPDQGREAIEAARGLVGDVLPVQVAADWAERALARWEAAYPADPRPRQAIAAARAWVSCPCQEHQDEAEAASGNADTAKDFPLLPPAERPSAEERRRQAEARLVDAILGPPARPGDRPEPDAAQAACSAAMMAADAAAYGASFAAESSHSAARWAADAADDAQAEHAWQRLRLAAYVLGEVER